MRMMVCARMRMAVACATVVFGAGSPDAAAASERTPVRGTWRLMTPTPKSILVEGRTVRTDGAMIITAGTEPKLRIAAAEINQRLLRELGAQPFVVKSGGVSEANAATGLCIVIGVSGKEGMGDVERAYPVSAPAKPEGYGIAMYSAGGKAAVVLSGHDAQGALYAAVTLRYLLEPARGSKIPNGEAVLRIATVEDWPDFRWRHAGRHRVREYWDLVAAMGKDNGPRVEEAGKRLVTVCNAYTDILLRHKINLTRIPVPHIGDRYRAGVSNAMLNHTRKLTDYGKARGLDFEMLVHSHIGVSPGHDDDLQKSRCVHHRAHKRYFCWSLLDEHREKAERYAAAMKEAGIRWFRLHAPDGGGVENPELWNDRCEHCRETYGDDRARADAAIFNTYDEVIRRQIPDLKMTAIVYPYIGGAFVTEAVKARIRKRYASGEAAEERAAEIAQKNQAFLRRVSGLLAAGQRLSLSSCPRQQYDVVTRCCGQRDLWINHYFAGSGRQWTPAFSMLSGWTRTWYRPGREDVFEAVGDSWGYDVLSVLMAAEFAWNVDAPGSTEFPAQALHYSGTYQHVEPAEVAGQYLAKLCTDLWGPEVGPHMIPTFDSSISYRFIQRPEKMIRAMRLQDPLAKMKRMVAATARSMAAMEQARVAYEKAVAAGRKPIPNSEAERYFGDYFRAALAARCAAAFRAAMMEAQAAVVAGGREGPHPFIARMQDIIAREKATWEKYRSWMSGIPCHREENHDFNYTFGRFREYDYSVLEEELAGL
jgi:hypothetical protein